MRSFASLAFCLTLALSGLAASSGCSVFSNHAHVKNGELFETGNAKYDAYFRQVHELQVGASSWTDERQASCKALTETLKLTPDAADVTIVQMTFEQLQGHKDVGATRLDVIGGDNVNLVAAYPQKASETTRSLFRAIEKCAHSELVRARQLKQVPGHAEELAKTGGELEPRIREDFAKEGGRVPTDVRNELRASLEILGTFGKRAAQAAREAEDFVFDLQRAVKGDFQTKEHEKRGRRKGATDDDSPGEKPKGTPEKPKKPKAKPVESKPAEVSADQPPPKPKAKPKPTESGDVFNP